MKAQTPVLQAKHREKLGSRYSQRVRKAGGLPAVVYGHGQDPVSISVDSRLAKSLDGMPARNSACRRMPR